MTERLVTAIAVVLAAGAIGFSVGRASEPAPAAARPVSSSATVRDLVTELRAIKKNTGYGGTLYRELESIRRATHETCVTTVDPGYFGLC